MFLTWCHFISSNSSSKLFSNFFCSSLLIQWLNASLYKRDFPDVEVENIKEAINLLSENPESAVSLVAIKQSLNLTTDHLQGFRAALKRGVTSHVLEKVRDPSLSQSEISSSGSSSCETPFYRVAIQSSSDENR